jgi:glycosyltransferase involved in cell wall biosynthesis
VNTSRFTKAKNHLILINAFSKIHHKYPEFKLEFYGEGPLKKNMQDRVLELNLTEKVLFHNPTTTVLKEIKNASIFVLPSNNEGYPNALVEALALGIPSISSDCRIGGPKDMINHGENGFLFEVGNENDLKLALDNLLSNKKVQQAFSTNSVDIVKKLNAESISMKWISFFEEVKSRNEEK